MRYKKLAAELLVIFHTVLPCVADDPSPELNVPLDANWAIKAEVLTIPSALTQSSTCGLLVVALQNITSELVEGDSKLGLIFIEVNPKSNNPEAVQLNEPKIISLYPKGKGPRHGGWSMQGWQEWKFAINLYSRLPVEQSEVIDGGRSFPDGFVIESDAAATFSFYFIKDKKRYYLGAVNWSPPQ